MSNSAHSSVTAAGLLGPARRYLNRIRGFSRNARFYLVCSASWGLAFGIRSLFLNLYALSAGYDQEFLGLLNAVPQFAALFVALPGAWLSDRLGQKWAMFLGALGEMVGYLLLALTTEARLMLLGGALAGSGDVLFVIAARPFLVENSQEGERETLFSLDFSLAIGFGFLANLAGGYLPGLFGRVLGVGAESVLAYRGRWPLPPASSLGWRSPRCSFGARGRALAQWWR